MGKFMIIYVVLLLFSVAHADRLIIGRSLKKVTKIPQVTIAASGSSGSSSTTVSSSSTSSVSGSGSSSVIQSGTASNTFSIDSGAVNVDFQNAYTSLQGGADLTSVLQTLLQSFVQLCDNTFVKLSSTSTSLGGGSTSGTSSIQSSVFQQAAAAAITEGFQYLWNTYGGTYAQSNPLDLSSQSGAISTVCVDIWTKVNTWGKGTAKAVAAADIQTDLSAFSQIWTLVYGKIQNIPGGSGSTATNGVSFVNNNGASAVQINYPYYQSEIVKLAGDAWQQVYNFPAGQIATVDILTNVFAQATAYIYADVYQSLYTSGNAQATSSVDLSAFGEAWTKICGDVQAAAGTTSFGTGAPWWGSVQQVIATAFAQYSAGATQGFVVNYCATYTSTNGNNNGQLNVNLFNQGFVTQFDNVYGTITQNLFASINGIIQQTGNGK